MNPAANLTEMTHLDRLEWLPFTGVDRLTIDQHSDEPSYIQLANQLREMVRSGQVPPRYPLPSITELTGETGLAVGTVRKAIKVLVDEGIVHAVPGRGTFAGPRPAR